MPQDLASIDIVADRHGVLQRRIVFVDINLTGASFASAVRADWEAAGSALAAPTVALVYTGTATVRDHILAGRLTRVPAVDGYTHDTEVFLSIITVTISKATMETFVSGSVFTEADELPMVWDLHVTPSGGIEEVWARGRFIVRPGSYR